MGDVGNREAEAFGDLYRDAWPRLFAYSWAMVRNYHDAEDVASEAFRRAYSEWTIRRPTESARVTWLLAIARNIIIDRARRRRLIAWIPLGPHDAGESASALDASDTALWFAQLARLLPRRQHEAFLLRYQFDLSDHEVARLMGIQPGAVRTHVSRALETLRSRSEIWR